MKLRFGIIVPAVLLLFSGCGVRDDPGEGWTAAEMARHASSGASVQLTELAPGSEEYELYASEYYGLKLSEVEDGCILAAGGSSAQEVSVFRFESAQAAETAAASLETYLESRELDFTGYMPAEAAMIAAGRVVLRGNWCAVIVLPDSVSGAEAFEDCFSSSPPPSCGVTAPSASPEPACPAAETEQDEWVYSESRIISAYRSGSRNGLDAHDIAILDAVDFVLTEVLQPGMSDYERELAVHDYIIDKAEYDSDTLSILPFFQNSPENTNPYGALIDGRAVCSGYSSTFQLFMKLIGIECITVHGEGNHDREEHAWNMVRLDGDWYCVDVTWDDPTGLSFVSESLAHKYFNVTSDFMRNTNHFWDESEVPEAAAVRYAWQP